MSNTILVVAPHADDETLGCGGTLLRHRAAGDAVHWLLVTDIPKGAAVGSAEAASREQEIEQLSEIMGFDAVHRLGLPPTELDKAPLADLINRVGDVVRHVEPEVVYLPFPGDTHSDHGVAFRASSAATKWFRYPSIRGVRLYETLSETNFAIDPTQSPFRPNCYVDISDHVEKKLEALAVFASEMGTHPFPRSPDSVRALATLRGSEAGVAAAEAFMIVKQIEK